MRDGVCASGVRSRNQGDLGERCGFGGLGGARAGESGQAHQRGVRSCWFRLRLWYFDYARSIQRLSSQLGAAGATVRGAGV